MGTLAPPIPPGPSIPVPEPGLVCGARCCVLSSVVVTRARRPLPSELARAGAGTASRQHGLLVNSAAVFGVYFGLFGVHSRISVCSSLFRYLFICKFEVRCPVMQRRGGARDGRVARRLRDRQRGRRAAAAAIRRRHSARRRAATRASPLAEAWRRRGAGAGAGTERREETGKLHALAARLGRRASARIGMRRLFVDLALA